MEDLFKSVSSLSLSFIEIFVFFIIRPLWKFMAHRVTGKCELERIVFHPKLNILDKNELIEYSLKNSRYVELSTALKVDVDEANHITELIVKVKGIDKTKNASDFKRKFYAHLVQILGYETLKRKVEIERTVFYDSNIESHEKLLLQLWTILNPETVLQNRISKQWPDIGFQGDDPATDFRGMGLLGLNQLIYFASGDNERARSIMTKSLHPVKGFPFAIVGISMTSLCRDLLKENRLKRSFSYSLHNRPPCLDDFHKIYCKTFVMFDKFWYSSNPSSIMEYVPLRTKFYEDIVAQLKSAEHNLFEIAET